MGGIYLEFTVYLKIQIVLGNLCFYLLNLATLAKGKLEQLVFHLHYTILHQRKTLYNYNELCNCLFCLMISVTYKMAKVSRFIIGIKTDK